MAKVVKFSIALLLFCLIVILIRSPVWANENELKTTFYQEHEAVADHLIVRLKKGQVQAQIARINALAEVKILSKLLLEDTYIVEIPEGKIDEYVDFLSSEEGIEYAEPDYIVHALETPNDPFFSDQWGLTKIETPSAWDLTHGSASVKIAVLDTGVSKNHPDLAPKVDNWVNFTSSSTEDDLYGHGTHVAGIAAAITGNGVGVAGVSYDARLLSVKVLGDNGSGPNSWVANGITWAADNGAKIINMSLGGGMTNSSVEQAINNAWQKGVVIVAAAGNDRTSQPSYPAYYERVVAVAATTSSDSKASFSNYGSWVEVAAPGTNIYSTYPGDSYRLMSGTSMASPFVAGLAGLLFGADSSLGNERVRALIEENSDQITGTGSYWIYGRINAKKAVEAIGGVAPTPTPTSVLSATPTPTVGAGPTNTPAPTTTIPPGQPCPNPCSAGKPSRRQGNANCDEGVDNQDYQIWKEQYLLYQAGQTLVGLQRLADFNCQPGELSTQMVDLIDFEFWRRNVAFTP